MPSLQHQQQQQGIRQRRRHQPNEMFFQSNDQSSKGEGRKAKFRTIKRNLHHYNARNILPIQFSRQNLIGARFAKLLKQTS